MGIFQLPNLCSTSQRTSCCASAVKSLIKIHPQNARRLLRKRPHGAVATYQPPYHQLYKYTQHNHGALTPSLPLLLLRLSQLARSEARPLHHPRVPTSYAAIRHLIAASAFIHAFAPLKSFRRIVVSFFDVDSAIRVKKIWDGEKILGEKVKIYFGMDTNTQAKDERLALPDVGKLFFISPPSPPHGWEMKME